MGSGESLKDFQQQTSRSDVVFWTVYCGRLEIGCVGSYPGEREPSRRPMVVVVVSQALNGGGLDQGHGGKD